MPDNTNRRSLLNATASKTNRRSVLKATAAGITGTAVTSGTASAVELFNSYWTNSTAWLHHEPDSSTDYDTRQEHTGMRTIDGPEYADGYTWWYVEINGDLYEYKKDRAWVAEKELAKSHFAYGSDCYFTSTHCENRGHEGVDIGCGGHKRYVFAAQEGTAYADWGDNGGYGNQIIIYHDNDYSTQYAHLSDMYVSTSGEYVAKGEKIGMTGNDGCEPCGVHLHQELRRYGNPIKWPHRVYDRYGNRIQMWRKTGIPQENWEYVDC